MTPVNEVTEKFLVHPELVTQYNPKILHELHYTNKQNFIDNFYPKTVHLTEYPYTPDLIYSVINQAEKKYFEDSCIQFGHILNKIYEHIIQKSVDEIIALFPAHKNAIPHLKEIKDNALKYARFDFLIDKNNKIKFCETNAHGGGGFSSYPVLINALSNVIANYNYTLPAYSDIDYLPQLILDDERARNIAPSNIGLFYSSDSPLYEAHSLANFQLIKLAESFNHMGRQANVYDAKKMTVNNQFSVIFPRIDARKTSMFYSDSYKPFLTMSKDNHVFSGIGLAGQTILQDKSLFTYIHRNLDIFDKEEQIFIQQTIPYTEILTPHNLDKSIELKDKLILKSMNDARGIGIYMGEDLSTLAWTELLCKKENHNKYIVQERIQTNKVNLVEVEGNLLLEKAFNNVYSAFYYHGNIMGFYDRIGLENIVNVAKKSKIRPIFYEK